MAARVWRIVVLAQLALAALVAEGVHAVTGRGLPAVAAAVGTVIALQLSFVTASILIGLPLAASRRTRPYSPVQTLRAALLEIGCFALAQLEMGLSLWRGSDRPAEPATTSVRPVLLLSGVFCNGAVWRSLGRRLRAAGYGPLRALDLEPLTVDIATHGPAVAAAIRDLRAAAQGARISIVAHSMGGLVARKALERSDVAGVSCLVTIGTPHHGSRHARLAPGVAARQLCYGSEFTTSLGAARAAAPPLTSIYSREDNLIAPPESAAVENACNVEFRGLGHFGLLRSRRVCARVLAALEAA